MYEPARDSKVRNFYVGLTIEQDVTGLDISMNLPIRMNVLQSFERLSQDVCYMVLKVEIKNSTGKTAAAAAAAAVRKSPSS
mmetsp:Transcript_22498/g.48721  ORF Transcript_22498/g.48721 Transcript_22498/m.48721 type:complete len:81 (+) Transcript_22498:8919-9161(+)